MTATAQRVAPTTGMANGAAPRTLQRACACGQSAGVSGKCANCEMDERLGSSLLHSGVAISVPGDPDEREADAIADRVMQMPGILAQAEPPRRLSRPEPSAAIRRKASPDPAPAASAVGIGAGIEAIGGVPLSATARDFFEPRIGASLGHVRLHGGHRAGALANALAARAFTYGPDIYFAPGEYDPSSNKGRHLLTHELAHVARQGRAADRIRRAPSGRAPVAARKPASVGAGIAKIAQLMLFMCRDAQGTEIIDRIERDGVNIVLFETAFDKWKYDDGREEENELKGLQGNTVVGTRTIRLRQEMSARQMGITLFHEMQHWVHNQDPAGPRGLESEIQARIATEQLAIDRGLPETGKGYRKADGTVDEAFIRKEINASPHYNPTGRRRIGRRYVGETPVPGPWRCPPVGDFPDPSNVRNLA